MHIPYQSAGSQEWPALLDLPQPLAERAAPAAGGQLTNSNSPTSVTGKGKDKRQPVGDGFWLVTKAKTG